MARSGHHNLPTLPSEASDNILEGSWGFNYLSRRVGPRDMISTQHRVPKDFVAKAI